MKANEFRIGNLIQPQQPTKIEHWMLNRKIEGNVSLIPIPLTEEWLEKLGFEKINRCMTLSFEKNKFQLENNILYWQQCEFADWCKFPCEYVHTLQNLYFAVTGVELI